MKAAIPPGLLCFGDGVDGQGCLTRGFGAVDLDDAAFGVTADSEGHIERDGARGG